MGRNAAPINTLAGNDDRSLNIEMRSITTIGARLRSGSLSSIALTKHLLRRIEAFNPELNAYVTVTADLAQRQANLADTELAEGIDRGPLHGIPIAIKDNIDTNGIRTTRGSKLFEKFVPERDAMVVNKLREAGAVLLGKTAMHELAYGMNGINPHFGPTRNPWNLGYDAGGSSSGSAAAVAAGLAIAAIGTDTGGSVRQPAHSCGIVGFKPTFGRISKNGVYPLAWSMDHVGPITTSVADARILCHALCGPDPDDPYSQAFDSKQSDQSATATMRDLSIGIVRNGFFEGRKEVVAAVDRTVGRLKVSGAKCVSLQLADLDQALRAARTTFAEANAVLWDELAKNPAHFGEDVSSKLKTAQALSAAEYGEAQHFRQRFQRSVEGLFEYCDVLAMPTSTITAAPIDARPDDHPQLAWRNCGIFNFTGHPAISLPLGLSAAGLPVGLMLVGALGADGQLLAYAERVEDEIGWKQTPKGFD